MTQSTSKTKYIDYLSEDPPIPGQLWVCISFLSPEGIKNCSLRGLKIRGVFGTKQEADKRAEELQKIDSDFHVFVGEMGKWLPWDPDPNDSGDQVYQEKELQDLMKGYKENLGKAAKVQEDRKKEMIQKAAREEQKTVSKTQAKNKTHARLIKQLEDKKKQESAKDELTKDDDEINQTGKKKVTDTELELKNIEEYVKQEEELAKSERERINETKKQIDNSAQNLESIDSKLSKIQELYERVNKKKQ